MTRVRIVTINTGKGDGPYAARIGWLADELGRLTPDIVLVQEGLRSVDGRLDTVARLADRLGMASAFAPARRKAREVEGRWLDTWSGLGFLSRADAVETTSLPLPDHPRDGERIAQLGRWPFGGGALTVANVHLTHLAGENGLRGRQLAATLTHPWLAPGSGVRLLGGDLNTDLAGLDGLRAAAAPVALVDAVAAGGGRPDRITVPVGQPGRPGRCLDHLLLVGDEASPVVTTGARVVLDRPDAGGIWPSDHYGVLVDLHLPD